MTFNDDDGSPAGDLWFGPAEERAYTDVTYVAPIHLKSWKACYGKFIPAEYLDNKINAFGILDEYNCLKNQGYAMWLAKANETPVAVAIFGPDPCDVSRGRIEALYVAAEWQDRGVGTGLLEAVLGELDYTEVVLKCAEQNEAGCRFWWRRGFRPMGQGPPYRIEGYGDVATLRYRMNTTAIVASGKFWLPETPSVTVRGEFEAEPGEKPEALLVNGLVEDSRVRRSPTGGAVYTMGPAGSVKAFLPITMRGRLDSGDFVTLIKAQNKGGPGFLFGRPHYIAHYAILGDRTVSGPDQLFSAIRFRFGDPYWLGHLREGESGAAVDSDGSTLSVEAADDGNWLLYIPATPQTLGQLESMVVLGCLTLAELALDQDFTSRDMSVRINDGDAWLSVHGMGANTPPNEFDYDTLLSREELTLDRFAKWIPINDTLDGLARVVARPVEGYLQTQALVVTTLLEGLHRRLHDTFNQSKFKDASAKALERIKKDVRDAAKARAADEQNLDPAKVRKAVMDAVSHFEDVDYLERADAVVRRVSAVVPEITESIAIEDLSEQLKNARNEMAHQLLLDEEKEPFRVRGLRWLLVAQITPWLLRSLLLLEAGIEPSVLRRRHLMNNRFLHFQANVAQFVRELGWEVP